jgi:hypothetical protein
MKANAGAAIERLRLLYAKRAEDRIFARMRVRLPPQREERVARMASEIPLDPFPPADAFLPLWDEVLSFTDRIEDDWIPSMYPRPYDQGLYGTLFGTPMQLDRVDGGGWVCSMTAPLVDMDYPELLARAADPADEWLRKAEADLRAAAAYGAGRFGVSVPITIDALNLAMQVRGSRALLDIYDCPGRLKAFLRAGVDLNITVVERLRRAIGAATADGVHDFFNAGWMPAQGIPMSVDCYNFCRPAVYEEYGLPYQQQLVDHFGGGNFHLHGNGRHLFPVLAQLKGLVVVRVNDDGSAVRAIDDLHRLKRTAGDMVLAVACDVREFRRMLASHSLPGGVHYDVGELETIDEANRLMESVRAYRC